MSVMRFGTFHLIGSPNMAPAAERFGETLEQIAWQRGVAERLRLGQAGVPAEAVQRSMRLFAHDVIPALTLARA